MPSSAGKTTLVVGIDFGTTFSGVAWLICKPGCPPDQPEVISLWETSTDNRRSNSDSQKVPSKVNYDENGELLWGFRIPAGVETIEWFKLLLLNDKDLQSHLQDSSHLSDAKKSLHKLGKTAVQLVGEYLKVLWSHTLKQIHDAKGQGLINGMPINVIITVPAIWTDYARDRMREAARLAGILDYRIAGKTTLSFISEPEAAAMATIPELGNRGDLQVGDSFIVVDAGGGTVDIISYKLSGLEPLSVSECVEGALCGGTFLDKEFEALLKNYIGKAAWDKMNCADIRRLMNNEWEHGIKEAFNGEPDYYTVEIPSRAQCVTLQLSSDELQPVFNKIVSQIGGLVKKQITAIAIKTSRQPKLVILVGGFGRSPYVLNYLRREVDRRLTVLQARGDKPWTAICRGAALSGAAELSSTSDGKQLLVKSRIARANYGWTYGTPFVKGVHDQRDRYWHEFHQDWYASEQMAWAVKRGEDISLKKLEEYPYIRFLKIGTRGRPVVSEIIYSCTDANPPSRKEGHLKRVAQVTLQLPRPVKQLGTRTTKDGGLYHVWEHQYKVVVSGASFDFILVSDGEEIKTEKILVDMT
ncbi:hypothetical protein F5X97DRAFT_336303 [Nemania serpens]|nr:hypothetical protein F5X97DRAFT_336303 [Nemania serpens]